jgi:hypothetical protein
LDHLLSEGGGTGLALLSEAEGVSADVEDGGAMEGWSSAAEAMRASPYFIVETQPEHGDQRVDGRDLGHDPISRPIRRRCHTFTVTRE